MEPFSDVWPTLLDRISRSEAFAVGTDFDGTIVPLMDRPEAVMLSERAAAVLDRLAARPRTSLAIVSGRSFLDLATRVPIPNAVLIGNHGLEVRVPGTLLATAYDDSDLAVARAVLVLLRERLSGIHDVQFEDKGPVVAVHYRRVPAAEVPRLFESLKSIAAQLGPLVRIVEGSAIFEFCPGRAFGKGSALLSAWAELGVPADATHLYFGNDRTDEDVFIALPADAVTVHVGSSQDRSAARYLAEAPSNVLDALEELDQVIAAREGGVDAEGDTLGGARQTPPP